MVSAFWIEPQSAQVSAELRQAVGGHPLVAEVLWRRGLRTPEMAHRFLDASWYQPTPAAELPGVAAGVERLGRALQAGERVVVWGDFDVDGQTSTAILVSALSYLGLSVRYYVPHRIDESHGLNRPALEDLLAQGIDLLVTCDCGVSDLPELRFCREQGLDVLVSDHHDLPEEPVLAPVVIDPKLLSPAHPLYGLCGAGVAFKLAEAVLGQFGRSREAESLWDLAALGTIADVVPLLEENRFLVQRGLPHLAAGRRLGVQTLARLGAISLTDTDTEAVAFELSPALNAAGRLASAELAVRLLLTNDRNEAEHLSAEVLRLNDDRRFQTRMAEQVAHGMIEKLPRPLPAVLVLEHPSWHPGVTGIVAGRLSESYHRPVVLVTVSENGLARGSARSVPGVDIHQAILQQNDLLTAQGGHPMAAGFALPKERLDEMTRRLTRAVEQMSASKPAGRPVTIDAWIKLEEASLELCDDLRRLAPFGEGNRPPILACRDLHLCYIQTLGDSQDDLRIRLADESGLEQDVLWWRGDRTQIPHQGNMDVAFTLRPNLYGGTRRLQMTLVSVRRSEAKAIQTTAGERTVAVHDHRGQARVENLLAGWMERADAGEGVMCWGEGRAAKATVGLRRRDQLRAAETLVVWSVPAGPDELRAALERSGATRLVLLCGHQPTDEPAAFLADLLGLLKYTHHRMEGKASLDTLAGVLGQRRGTVWSGLEVLQQLGACRFDLAGSDGVLVQECREPGAAISPARTPGWGTMLRLLTETGAYRRFFRRASPADLLPEGIVLERGG